MDQARTFGGSAMTVAAAVGALLVVVVLVGTLQQEPSSQTLEGVKGLSSLASGRSFISNR
jgi:hypothetical protein